MLYSLALDITGGTEDELNPSGADPESNKDFFLR